MNKIPFMLRADISKIISKILPLPMILMIAAVAVTFFTNITISNIFSILPLLGIPLMFPLFLFYLELGSYLQNKLPKHLKFDKSLLLILFAVEIILLFLVVLVLYNVGINLTNMEANASNVMIAPPFFQYFALILLSALSFAAVCFYSARAIKTLEFQKKVSYKDSLEEFKLLTSFPKGISIIQNRIDNYNSKDND